MTMAMISLALLSLFLSHLTILTAQLNFTYTYCSFNDTGNYTATSAYHTNLNILLLNLTSNKQIDYGFYNFSYGQNPDRVSAIGLCRGDIKPDACRGCLKNSSILLPKVCPVQKHALAGYDECMLRYSSLPILGIMDDSFSLYVLNLHNVTEVDKHKQAVNHLMERLRKKAAVGDSRRKFAAGNETSLSIQPVYGLVQCTPDLSEQDCSDCLVTAISEIPKCCENRLGGRVIKNSCNIQFESTRFYDPAADDSQEVSSPVSPSSPNSTSSKGHSNTSRTIIVIIVSTVAFILLLFLIYIFFGVRKSKKASKIIETERDGDQITDEGSIQFDFDTIRLATDDFSDENKLGQGGFGPVYKGTLYNGQEIAVKRLSMGFGQGNLEFKNEVLLVAKLQHRNLVRLLGFCLEREERVLIYEFLPNKSLDYFIFDPNKHAGNALQNNRRHCSWPTLPS